MKKIIRKFWGVGLIVVLLSTLLMGAVPQASAANYDFSADLSLPAGGPGTNGLLAGGFGFNDVAQSGSVIYAAGTGTIPVPYNLLYTSPNGGGMWYPVAGVGLPALATSVFGLVAVAPDDPNVVAVVDTDATLAADRVYLSTNGGATFSALTAFAAGTNINSIAISSLTDYRYLAVGGSDAAPGVGTNTDYVAVWKINFVAPVWTVPGNTVASTVTFNSLAANDVDAVAFSSSFSVDEALLVVNETISAGATNGSVKLHLYSFMFDDWNAGVDVSYPRTLESTVLTALDCDRATIALDSEFTLGENEVGFIGADIDDATATGEIGGVYRMSTGIGALTQIYTAALTGYGMNSVAWDGTNLMAAEFDTAAGGAITIYRCGNALASTSWAFLPSSAYKTPGTGTLPLVLFNGGAGWAFSQGTNSAIAKSTDYGKSFNGVAVVNSDFTNMIDFWINPDGSRIYALTDDTVDLNLWSKSGGVWQRIFILAGGTGTNWLVRADADTPDNVYLGKKAFKNMFKSIDGGQFVWTQRSCTQLIADFAVQDATTVYVAVSGGATVVKTTTGASGWHTPVATYINYYGGTCYSINLIGDNKLLVGGTAGAVAYSADGNTTWTAIPVAVGTGATLTAATGLAAGDTIWAASTGAGVAASSIGKWLIGTSTALTGWSKDTLDGGLAALTSNVAGLVYVNGILYAWDNDTTAALTPTLYRYLYPTIYVTFADNVITAAAWNAYTFTQANMINALQATTGSTTLWARESGAAPDILLSYTEYMVGPGAAPVLISPINNEIIPVNSISGATNAFVFRWQCPPAISTNQAYTFDLNVYLDELGTILVGNSVGVGYAFGGGTSSTPGALGGAGGVAFVGVPGETYYWKVRVTTPVDSYFTPMATFTIQQLAAIVPTIASPPNGATGVSDKPSFSWNPIAGVTKYEFQLSDTTNFDIAMFTEKIGYTGIQPAMTFKAGKTYFWRVRALEPATGEWSTVGNFTVAVPAAPPAPPVTVLPAPTPTITVVQPPVTVIIPTTTPAPVEEISPAYIWAIIIIGAVLVIAVIVLIVRTRRSV